MTNNTALISQIKEKESGVKKMLEKVEVANNERIALAIDEAAQFVKQAEDDARLKAQQELGRARETAKAEYKKVLVNSDNERRDVVEGGKVNIQKAQKLVDDAFEAMFQNS